MSIILNVLLPIFVLILVGLICRRSNRLGPTAASEMNRFVVWLGLPSLLLSLTAKADWAQIWQPGFLLAFTGGMLAVFVLTLEYRWKPRHRAVHARRVLPASGGAGVTGDPVLHPRFAADLGPDPTGDHALSCSSTPSCCDRQGQRCQADAVFGAARCSR